MSGQQRTSETRRVAAALAARAKSMRRGDEIGSIRGIAVDMSVSDDVARKALRLLVADGVVAVVGRRHVVTGRPAGPVMDVSSLEERVRALEEAVAGAGWAVRVSSVNGVDTVAIEGLD